MSTTAIHTIENQIVNLLGNGDQRAVDLIYDNYADTLLGVIFKMVQDEIQSEDILQDVIVKIWNNTASYDPQKGRLYTWMLNICRNTTLDYLRSAAYKNKTQSPPEFDENEENDNWAGSIETNVNTIGVKAIVNKLGNDHRQVIDLMYFKGMTQQEVSEQLEIPLGTVKTRARLAMNKLREIFKS